MIRESQPLTEKIDISLREIKRGGTKLIVVPEDSVSLRSKTSMTLKQSHQIGGVVYLSNSTNKKECSKHHQ